MATKHIKFVVAAVLAVFSASMATIFSSETALADSKPAIHLQVSPVKQKVALTPGTSYVSSFKVMNVGAMKFSYSVAATPYSVTGETYSADYSSVKTYSQISKWITVDEKTGTGTLEPGESIDVAFTVNVPKDAPAGGQYAAMMAQTEDGNDDDANIKVVNRVGMIFYANIAGKTRAEGNIIDNKIPSFVFNPPLTVTSLVDNTGNVENTAEYVLKIWPLFDKETIYNNEEQPGRLDIMPETRRFSSITWEGAPKLGIFWVEQTINYLEESSVNHKLVIICPLWLLFIILLVVFFMIFWLISRIKNRKNETEE